MEELKDTRVLRFRDDTLEEVRHMRGITAAGIAAAIDAMQRWINEQPHFLFKNIPRCYLENILISSKGSVVRAQQMLDFIFTSRTLKPQYFGDFDRREDFPNLNGNSKVVYMPHLTSDFNRISITRISGEDGQLIFNLNMMRSNILYIEYMKFHDYNNGLIPIVDFSNVNLVDILKKTNLTVVQEGHEIISKAYGARIVACHLLCKSKFINGLLALAKQVLGSKMFGRIMVHESIDSVYEHVPRDLLPEDYGGKEKPFDDLYEEWIEELTSDENRANVRLMMRVRTDESLRPPTQETHSWSVPGSFRSLDVD